MFLGLNDLCVDCYRKIEHFVDKMKKEGGWIWFFWNYAAHIANDCRNMSAIAFGRGKKLMAKEGNVYGVTEVLMWGKTWSKRLTLEDIKIGGNIYENERICKRSWGRT
jgi:hypothetical protein